MVGVDTNILVYAHRSKTFQHQRAVETLSGIVEKESLWAIAWPSFYEFIRVVTHPKVVDTPSTLDEAFGALEDLTKISSLRLLGHSAEHFSIFKQTVEAGAATGNLVFDAQIAAIMKENGVTEIVTADRDFYRFNGLKITNPFI